ncbi:hypothetical protein M9H77_09578 [Catharanthus roseus]|uniref:Uncharacterized protein n=1 Tax=Catharanthus roseus TaxID=4058 RepID=A0ACC0C1J4_CATRO|nr:hypothetical protein M9H77_09578 [Catharanthus roseus]
MKSREQKVTAYNPREGIYIVRSPIRVSGMGNNVYTLRLIINHVVAENGKLCRENGSRTDTYVPEIYSRETYRRIYQVNFHPILSENFWRDVPFNLTFYPPNMKMELGRKQLGL